MAKYCNPNVLDSALNALTDADEMVACDGQPTDYADVATKAKATADLTGGDFSLADGDTGGRKLVVAEKNGVDVDDDGVVDHVALIDTSTSELLYVTTADPQSVTVGSYVNFPEWSITIEDPV